MARNARGSAGTPAPAADRAAAAPAADQAAAAPTAAAPSAAEQAAGLRGYIKDMGLLMMGYTLTRAAWHVGVPAHFGVPPFVPLTGVVAALQAAALLLLWAGGGFGGRERAWLVSAYSMLSMAVVGKCVLDVYLYQIEPRLWPHFDPTKPWGVPALLEARLPNGLPGMEARLVSTLARWFEYGVDTGCLLLGYRGVRAGKSLIQARRAARKEAEAAAPPHKAAQQKKDE